MTETTPVYNAIKLEDIDGQQIANKLDIATIMVVAGGEGMTNLTANLYKMVERKDWPTLFAACETLRSWSQEMHAFNNALQILDGYRYLQQKSKDDDKEEKPECIDNP